MGAGLVLTDPAFLSMKTGILLVAFGRPAYMKMAYNMARSLKYFSPNVKIALATDGSHTAIPEFAKCIDVFVDVNSRDAGTVKTSLHKLTPFENTLYLDVDGICLKDINPLIDYLLKDGRPFASDVQGQGKINDSINYCIWARKQHIWAWFELSIDDKFQAFNTSFMWFTQDAAPMFEIVEKKRNFPHKFLTHKWGNSIPDELIYGGCAAKCGFDAKLPFGVVFFGNRKVKRIDLEEMTQKHYINSMYGNSNLVLARYRRMYDQVCSKVRGTGKRLYRASDFINDKFVNHV